MRVFLAIVILVSARVAAAAPPANSNNAPSPAASSPATGTAGGQQLALGPAPASPARTVPPETVSSTSAAASGEDRPPILGLTLDGGFPDGLALSALYRPVRPLRLDAGLTYNMIGFGLRGGVTFVPFRSAIAPVLRGELGHTFNGDATGLVGHFTTLTPAEQILLRSVSYDYASVQLGLEIGASDRLVFFARGGLAWFWTTVQNFQAAAQTGSTSVSQASDPNVHGTVPTATLGLLFYFW
jgi:hypothetical protein